MIIILARFYVIKGNNYKLMKSSMTLSDTQRDDYNPCEDSILPFKNQIIIM